LFMRTDGKTETSMRKLIAVFRNIANAPKNCNIHKHARDWD